MIVELDTDRANVRFSHTYAAGTVLALTAAASVASWLYRRPRVQQTILACAIAFIDAARGRRECTTISRYCLSFGTWSGPAATGQQARLRGYLNVTQRTAPGPVGTLRAWLDAFADFAAASAAIRVHPNTFRYRMRRLSETR